MYNNDGLNEPEESNLPENEDKTQDKKQVSNKKDKVTMTLNVTYRVIRAVIVSVIVLLVAIGLFGAGIGSGYFAALARDVDVPDKETLERSIYNLDQQSRITYSDDSLVSVIKSDLIRTNVSYENISPLVEQALVATEDENFYLHDGIVPKAIARAMMSDILGVGSQSGGSTITQQLIKQQLLTNETSYERKLSEMLLAMRAENFFSKEEIINSYLNVSPFGRNNKGENIAGIEEAARGVFGVSAKEVSLPQAAFLAGLPQSPIEYTPYTNEGTLKEDTSLGLDRKDDVLYNMYRKNYISEEEYNNAIEYDLAADFIDPKPRDGEGSGFLYNYLYDEAARVMMPIYYEKDKYTKEDIMDSPKLFDKYFNLSKKELTRGGYTVHSTIDKDIHNGMQDAVSTYGYILDDGRNKTLETGSVLMDNSTGRIYGFIGGRNYENNQNNHAFQTRRSPGSTMKPILAYAPAIDVGLIGSESMLSDFPLKYADGKEVKNYSDTGSKSFKSVRESLKWSLNIPVVNLYNELQYHTDPKDYFDKMDIGLNPDEYYRESIPLGGTDDGLTVIEETEAYATLANKGQFNDGYSIDKITDNDGNVLYEHESNPIDVFKPATASIMNDMMRDVVKSGTGKTAQDTLNSLNPTLAKADWVGKTGTSENEKDYWFTASTPAITMSSWIGYDDNTIMYQNWNKQNMIYWAYITNHVYQINPSIFGASEKFELDSSVRKEKVVEFTGEKKGTVTADNRTIKLDSAKEVTSLYAAGYPDTSQFRFGIGGTDANYQTAWNSFRLPAPSQTPKKKETKKNTTNRKKDKKNN